MSTLGIDAYQLTTLLAHADEGRLHQELNMAFFFRKLPKARNYVVFAGLRRLLDGTLRFTPDEIDTLLRHELIGPALKARPQVLAALRALDGFEGEIDALPEGTLAFAGPGRRTDGSVLMVNGLPVSLYTPMIEVRTSLLTAKLIETPWLGAINYLSMVASKAARVVEAAAGKAVYEFGGRRTHPDAAVDAAYAAYLAGAAGTSNLLAQHRYGVPARGTMDHFYVQAAERDGTPRPDTERQAFGAFAHAFPSASTMLVDTYDTEDGIRQAVAATDGKLSGIRLDSNVNPESVQAARALLKELGAPHAQILVSDGLDEYKVQALAPYVDSFGVGENITCSPDSPVGIGAVAKVVVNGYGRITMKIARGSGKATLPGRIQAWRFSDHDLIALQEEAPPTGGQPLLKPIWRGKSLLAPLPSLENSRAATGRQIASLSPSLRGLDVSTTPRPLVASDRLVARIEELSQLS